jgi:hypothetical protein
LTMNVDGGEEAVLRVFCRDYSAELYLTAFAENIPIDLIEAVIARAKRDLPEKPDEGG